MSNQMQLLYQLPPQGMIVPGTAAVIEQGYLQRNMMDGRVFIQLVIRNISFKNITSMNVSVHMFGVQGQDLGWVSVGLGDYVPAGAAVGNGIMYDLTGLSAAGAYAASVEALISQVWFEDGSSWSPVSAGAGHVSGMGSFAQEPEKKSKAGVIVGGVIGGMVLLGALACLLIFVILPSSKYKKAEDALKSGDYQQAKELFEELEDYKDSRDRIRECDNRKTYAEAEKKVEDGEFEEAIALWESIRSFLDSEERIQDAKAMWNDTRFQEAMNAYASGNYAQSIAALDELKKEGYPEANDIYSEVAFHYGKELMSAGDYGKALEYLSSDVIGTYSLNEAEALRKECHYYQGVSLIDAGSFESAITELVAAGDFEGSSEKLTEAKYGFVLAYYDSTDLTTYEYMKELVALNYYDSSYLFDELYAWGATDIVVNTSEGDTWSDYTSLSKYSTIYMHCVLTGGEPGETATFHYGYKWPGYDLQSNSFAAEFGAGDGVWMSTWYNNPAYGNTGTLTMYIYDDDWHVIAERSITITN